MPGLQPRPGRREVGLAARRRLAAEGSLSSTRRPDAGRGGAAPIIDASRPGGYGFVTMTAPTGGEGGCPGIAGR